MPRKIKAKDPKLRKQKIKFQKIRDLTVEETTRALKAASMAIDQLQGENTQLRRFVAMERAQVIYYTEQAVSFCERKNVAPTVYGLPRADRRSEAAVSRAGDQGARRRAA